MLQLYREWRVKKEKNKSTRKRRKNSFHFRLSTKHALPALALALFTTYSIPLTFTSPGEFCYVLHWMRGWLLFRCCFFYFYFRPFSFLSPLSVCCGGFVVCVCLPTTHTQTHHTLPWTEKKNTCFYGFQSSLIQRSFFSSLCFPLISADQNPS